jgi:Transposase DDE domain group 1
VKRSKRVGRVKVSADGTGVVSHAGVGLLRELAEHTGLVDGVTAALIDTYKGMAVHAPGRVFTDLATAVADGADAISGIAVLTDREELHGPVASVPTAWRLLARIDEHHLPAVREARSAAREVAWAAGAAPDLSVEQRMDFDATITIAHSEKQNAAATWKKTFGFHPLLCFLDRPDVAGGEALAGLLRAGNAGSNTAADHVAVLDMALAALPERARPRPGDPDSPDSPRLLARSDSAGATHGFAAACRDRGVGFSFGFAVSMGIQAIVNQIPAQCWMPAIEADGQIRDGAWVAEATDMTDPTKAGWPQGSRLILRKERPHPGAQLTFTDADGMRVTAFLTDTPPGALPGQIAGLELRHRQHARVEDRIREAKTTGLRNLPCRGFTENAAWLETVLCAVDLVCWTKLICFHDVPELAKCEISTFRYRVLHVAARLTRGARYLRLRIDKTWRWATQIAAGFHRLRAAFN